MSSRDEFLRVFGLETEYGLLVTKDERTLDPTAAAEALFRSQQIDSQSDSFLRNGGRLYQDVGAHPEYATAECSRVDELLAQDRAGDLLLLELAEKAQGEGYCVRLFRNNFDPRGNSFGCHENYALFRSTASRVETSALTSFLALRTVLTGAGSIRGNTYVLSGRALEIATGYSSHTTRERPFVNTREQALADAGVYRRLHVISGDTNVLASTNLLKLSLTLCFISALEAGHNFSEFTLEDPVAAAAQISRDRKLIRLYRTVAGKEMSALELLSGLITQLAQVSARMEISGVPQAPQILERSQSLLDSLAREEYSSCAPWIDWCAKYLLISGQARRRGISEQEAGFFHSEPAKLAELQYLDAQYHEVGGSLQRKIQSWGDIRADLRAEDIKRATQTPPQSTRARDRGAIIAAAAQHNCPLEIDWDHVRLLTEPPKVLRFPTAHPISVRERDAFIDQIQPPTLNFI